MRKFLALLVITLCCSLMSELVAQQPNAQPAVEKKTAINPNDYVGRFEADPAAVENFVFDVFLEKDQLWIKPSHQPKQKLVAKSADTFLVTDLNLQFKFTRDAKGQVDSLVLTPPEASAKPLNARKLVLPQPSAKGNTTLRLKGHPDARIVAVAGTFNEWNQSQAICGKEANEWICRLDLSPGKYTYKFIIDGDWILDPDNPNTEDDERGFTNSVLVVKGQN
jgi:Glycogen recognition site of AMP-activated protein kinase/Domain of unknown function (DUF3471)